MIAIFCLHELLYGTQVDMLHWKMCLEKQCIQTMLHVQCLKLITGIPPILCMHAGYQPPHASGRHSGPRRVEDPHFHHATPMDIVPNEDKGNISDKLETIDYSHGALGSGRVGSSAIQSVDYHHGQGGVPDQSPPIGGMVGNFSNPIHSLAASVPPMIPNPAAYQPPVLPDLAAYGGFPAYANYEGYPPGGGSYQGLFPAGAFFSGLDPAAIFAAYTEQTGMYGVNVVVS